MVDCLRSMGRRRHIGAAGLVILACLLYLPTVQPDISASGNVYLRDVGNAQNALAQWGTLHGSAFPLYSFTGAMFVALLRGVGMAPALAASLYSSVWAILALVALYAFLMAWLNDRVAAVLAASLLGVGWIFWLHGSIAEVYSPSLFVVIGALWLALKADQTGRVVYVYGLAICCGLAVSHHRAIALALPAPALIAAPAALSIVRRQPRVLLECAGLALVSGVMPYLYLLIRAQQGAPWIFGDPSTLAGLRRIMVGESYATLVSWPATLEGWLERLRYAGQIGLDVLTWPVALAGAAGIGWMLLRSSRRYGWALLLGAAVPLGAAITIQTDLSDAVVEAVPPLVKKSSSSLCAAWRVC